MKIRKSRRLNKILKNKQISEKGEVACSTTTNLKHFT